MPTPHKSTNCKAFGLIFDANSIIKKNHKSLNIRQLFLILIVKREKYFVFLHTLFRKGYTYN